MIDSSTVQDEMTLGDKPYVEYSTNSVTAVCAVVSALVIYVFFGSEEVLLLVASFTYVCFRGCARAQEVGTRR